MEEQLLEIVCHAKSKLDIAIDSIETINKCKDNIIKAVGIMDLLSSMLQTKIDEKRNHTEEIKPEIYHIDNDNTINTDQINNTDNNNINNNNNNCTRRILFENIIGNQHAKQSLYENVILPLSFSPSLKKKVFAGIRKGTGNVLLHGPPGILIYRILFYSNLKSINIKVQVKLCLHMRRHVKLMPYCIMFDHQIF